ncbi:MAG TPA: SRPBCC family protein [Noviherbaspirillum sp.]|nr:SRPBCC family protein [Noviherbaspirillum sp.]
MTMLPTRTISVSIACPPARVYDFIRDARTLPRWATAFCKSVVPDGGNWIVFTLQGPLGLRFVEPNAFGVLDHYIRLTPDFELYVPLRVVPNYAGSEVIFTLFRLPDIADEQFAADAALVQDDLNNLKRLLEA